MEYKSNLLAVSVLVLSNSVNAATITLNAVNSGSYVEYGTTNGTTSNIFSGINGAYHYNNWLGFDLSSVSGTITSASLEVASNSYNNSGQTFTWYEVSTPYANLGTTNGISIYNDLASGTVFASGTHTAGIINSFNLNTDALASLNSTSSFWAIGGHNPEDNWAFGFTGGVGTGDHIQLHLEVSANPLDSDGDSIVDSSDNCTMVANSAQRDTDGDGYGNYCDPDFDNDGFVNAADLAYMKANFFSADPDADLDGSGFVNAADLAILKQMFFGPPGPSGLVP